MENSKDPIAIVGIGCRFPGGASSPKAFWNLLRRKKDAIVETPRDRWDLRRFYDDNPDKPGKTYVREGGFLKEKIDRFDPLFFGISPREAESLDPQQRLLLEVTWEAFEDGGLIETELRGSQTGVFIGGFCMDSMLVRFGQLNRDIANSHSAASSTMTMLSNRISYTFDLKGPSVSMDTACSSSLVATHFACRSLWSGESEMAIAGGVNVMLRPEFPIVMSKGKFLSPHGRCKAFDEDAAGYGRGEGAGVVILKPLSKALANGDRVYGLIRETGINQDGHTAGITLPDSQSQENLMREVYRRAGVSPGEIGFVEAHGTGTQAGDPAEVEALSKVLSEGRREAGFCHVGSVKTNIGHLEAGAGVAGLIKAVLSLHHEAIPPNLHFNNPNPKIPWSDICIQIPTKLTDWKRSDNPRYAGVNSFGYGGANAHVLLQEAPSPAPTQGAGEKELEWDRPLMVPLSARSEEALRDVAAKYAFQLASCVNAQSLANFCYTVTCRRTHHPIRATVLGKDAEALRLRLQQFSTGDFVEQSSAGRAVKAGAEKLVFVYTGMGPQWWGMGRELMKAEPVFRSEIEKCDEAFRKQADWSILEELCRVESKSRMAETEVAQPANFVVQIALTRLWREWGIEPYSVIGHSVGEVAAAYVSGALSLEDAITVSLFRSRLQQTLAGKGAMVAAGISERRALAHLETFPGVSIAAVNSPNSVTLSGESDQIETLTQSLEAEGLFARRLKVEVAYHSSQMEPIKESLLGSLESIQPQAAAIPLYSTVVGDRVAGDGLDANYWWHNVRQPVRFLDGIRSIMTEGCSDFLEVGPHPVLGHSIKEIAAESGSTVRLSASLNRKEPEQTAMLESLGRLYTQGQPVNWAAVTPRGGRFTPAPTYPWQRERYWIESDESREDRISLRDGVFLNRKLNVPQPTWSVEINEAFFPYLKDHVVNGQVVFPGAGYVEAGLMMARHFSPGESLSLRDVRFHSMLQWDETTVQTLYTSYNPQSGVFYAHSGSSGGEGHWQLLASGELGKPVSDSSPKRLDIPKLKPSFGSEERVSDMYAMLSRRGMQYGERFRFARRLWTQVDQLWVKLENEGTGFGGEAGSRPEILDTAFHSLLSVIEGEQPYVPQVIGRIKVYRSIETVKWIHGKVTLREKGHFYADLRMIDADGNVCVAVRDVFMRQLPRASSIDQGGAQRLLYVPRWKACDWEADGEKVEESTFVFVGENEEALDGMAPAGNRESSYLTVCKGTSFCRDASSGRIHIREERDEDYDQLFEGLDEGASVRILYFWSLEIGSDSLDFEEMVKGTLALTRLVQAIGRTRNKRYSLLVVTKGAHSLGREESLRGLNASPLGGLIPLFENEYDNLDCRLVDLDPDADAIQPTKSQVEALFDGASDTAKEVAIRNGEAYALSLNRFEKETGLKEENRESVSPEERVVVDEISSMGSPFFRKAQRLAPGKGEIEIRAHYLCTGGGGSLGRVVDFGGEREGRIEYFGTVVRTGRDCGNYAMGDRVLSLGSTHIENYTTVDAACVLGVPDAIEFDRLFGFKEAVAAYYALVEVARLKPNETVVVDQFSGGVGFFAIQIVQHLDAKVFAVTDESSEFGWLQKLSPKNLIDGSREEIVEQIFSKNEGEGADVFLSRGGLDSLQEAVDALAPCGCYLEIPDSLSGGGSPLPRAAFERNLRISFVDIDRLISERPTFSRTIAQHVLEGFVDGWLSPLPVQCFTADSINDAVDELANAQSHGGVSLQFESVALQALPETGEDLGKEDAGTVVVTGGNSGFGLQVAKWLANATDYRIALISRSGAVSEEASSTIAQLRETGADVVSEAIDVSSFDDLKAFTDRMAEERAPVRGVLHGAMVLEDAFVQDLEEQGLRKVMSPKVRGAINLYQCVKDTPIEFLVCFSSVSSLVGNRGQASYVAANSFLDAFSQRLRGLGFPALAINWGALSESGVVARNEVVGQLLEKEGVLGITNQQALSALEQVLSLKLGQIGVFDMDWDRWRESNPKGGQSSRFSSLLEGRGKTGQNARATVLLEALDGLESADQLAYLTNLVITGLSKVLKIPSEKIGPDNTLDNLGIDSLMLIELSLTILSEFGLNIPAAELPKYPTVTSLAGNIHERLDRIRQTSAA